MENLSTISPKEIKKISAKNADMAKAYLDILKDSIKAIDTLSLSLHVKSNQLELNTSLKTFKDGDFADLVRALSKLVLSGQLLVGANL